MLIPGNKNQCHHSFLSSASCCWSFRLLPTSHTTQKKEDEFSDVRGCGSRLEHSKLIVYICELAFSLFSLSLSPLYLILYFLLLSFFLYILVREENERTNEKEYPRLRNIYQPPVGSSGNIVGHAIAWAKKKKKGKKPLALFLSFFNIDIYRGKKKKPPSALFQLRAHSWNCCCCCTTPWLYIPEPFPETSNDLKPHWYFTIFSFFFFYFSFFLF